MFVGNEDRVYILDKAEGNAVTINGHPAWGAAWYGSFFFGFLMKLTRGTGTLPLAQRRQWTSVQTLSAPQACIFPTVPSSPSAGTAPLLREVTSVQSPIQVDSLAPTTMFTKTMTVPRPCVSLIHAHPTRTSALIRIANGTTTPLN